MRRIYRYKSDLILLLLAIVSVAVMFKASDDPLVAPLVGTRLGHWLTQWSNGNQVVFALSAGILSAILAYYLLVRLPEERKRRRVLGHLEATFRETKLGLIRLYLSLVVGSYASDLPESLLEPHAFRAYFDNDRWCAVANGINPYWLKEMQAELEILHNELQFALAAVEPRNSAGYSRLKSVAAWTIRSRNIDLDSDDLKPFLRALWQMHTGFNFVEGHTGRDVIAGEIRSL